MNWFERLKALFEGDGEVTEEAVRTALADPEESPETRETTRAEPAQAEPQESPEPAPERTYTQAEVDAAVAEARRAQPAPKPIAVPAQAHQAADPNAWIEGADDDAFMDAYDREFNITDHAHWAGPNLLPVQG